MRRRGLGRLAASSRGRPIAHALTSPVPEPLGRRRRGGALAAGAAAPVRERAQGAAAAVRDVRRGRRLRRPGAARGDLVDADRRPGPQRQRLPRGGARQGVPAPRRLRDDRHRSGSRRQRESPRQRAGGLRAVLLPLRDGDDPQRGRSLSDRAPGGLPPAADVRILLLPGLHARLLQRPRCDGRRGPRLRRLPRRLHLRGDLPHARRRNSGARGRDRVARLRRHPADGDDARALPREVRALPRRQVAAQGAREGADDRRPRRPRGPGQLRRRGARRRPPRRAALQPRARARRPARMARGDAHLHRAARRDLPAAALRQDDGPDHARPAQLPRRPALRGRHGPALPRAAAAA